MKKDNPKNKKAIHRREPLTDEDKELMMQILLRSPAAFERAKDQLQDEHFGEYHAGYNLLWNVIVEFYDQYGKTPELEFFQAGVAAKCKADRGLLTEDEREEVDELLLRAFADNWAKDPNDPAYVEWGINTVQKFIEEGLARQIQSEVLSQRGRVAADLPAMLEEIYNKVAEVQSMSAGHHTATLPEDWDVHGGINIVSSGLPFLDDFYNGGMAAGEVYGILGPYGSCKTMLSVMLAVEAARRAAAWKASEDWDGRHGVSFVFSYEAALENELRIRIVSYAAEIDRNNLESMGPQGKKTLSTSTDLETLRLYEKHKYKTKLEKGAKVQGEQERMAAISPWINNHLIVVDLTGSDPNRRGAGTGGIDEVARIIGAELRRLRAQGLDPYVEHVSIDYVGVMVKRQMAAQGRDESALRHYVTDAPSQAKRRIAVQYQCPVTLIHQLAGKVNDFAPHKATSHTDAAESKSFGENLDFCTCVSKPTFEGLCRIECTKHRRAQTMSAQIVRIVGKMSAVRSTGDKYAFDPNSGVIKLAKDVHAIITHKDLPQAPKLKLAKQPAGAAEYNPTGGW